MTNRDPYENPHIVRPANDQWGTGTIVAMVVAAIVLIGGIMYALTSDRSSTTAATPPTDTSAPSTTGQAPPRVPTPTPPAQK